MTTSIDFGPTRSYSYREAAARLTPRSLRTAITRGDLVRVLPNRYVAGPHATAFAPRAHAAVAWAGAGARVGGASALFVWGAMDDPPGRIDVIARAGTARAEPPWVRLRRAPDSPHLADWNGTSLELPERAVIQLFGDRAQTSAAAVVYRALQRRVVTTRGVRAALLEVARVRDRAHLLRILAAFDEGAESYLEQVSLRKVFNTKEFARFVRQHRVVVEGQGYRLDMFDPATRTAVELDGGANHTGTDNRQRDITRDVILAGVGIQTLRFSYEDITNRPEWCRERVRAAIAARGDTEHHR